MIQNEKTQNLDKLNELEEYFKLMFQELLKQTDKIDKNFIQNKQVNPENEIQEQQLWSIKNRNLSMNQILAQFQFTIY
jgi:hypothetical protein